MRVTEAGRVLKPRILVLLLLVGAGAIQVAPPAGAAQSTFASYVALGDSFAAGPLIPVTDPRSLGCLRSSSNYPRLLSVRFQVANFKDVSCSGAATRHMYEPQLVQGGANPPQLDALDPTTQLVTVQIGGNDIGYAELATNCATLTPLGTPCRARYAGSGEDEISYRIDRTRGNVEAVLADIRRRAPEARILVLGYPSLLPEGAQGCWPFMPYSPEDVPYLVAKQIELNTMLSDSAAANGAVYVDTYTPSLGRDACRLPTVRWAEPVLAPIGAAPVHPNAAGMGAMADQVAAAINATVP